MRHKLFTLFAILILCNGCSQNVLKTSDSIKDDKPSKTESKSASKPTIQKPQYLETIPETPHQILEELTVNQAIEIAEKYHPKLAEMQAHIEQAKGRTMQSSLMPNPALIGRMESAPFSGDTADNAEYVFGIEQTIPLGKRLTAARHLGESEQNLFHRELHILRLNLHVEVQKAFAEVLYWQNVTQSHQDNLQITEKAVAVAQARLDHGETIAVEVEQAQIEVKRVQLNLQKSQSHQMQSIETLLNAMGRPDMEIKSLNDSPDDISFKIPTLDLLLSHLETNPQLQFALQDVALQKHRITLAKEEKKTDVGLEMAYRRLSDSEDAFDIGFSIPLPLNNNNQGNIIAAKGGLAGAMARLGNVKNDLHLKVRVAHQNLQRAVASAQLLQDELLPQTRRVLEVAEKRYAGGDISLAEILPLRRDLNSLNVDYLQSLRDVRQAWAELIPYTWIDSRK